MIGWSVARRSWNSSIRSSRNLKNLKWMIERIQILGYSHLSLSFLAQWHSRCDFLLDFLEFRSFRNLRLLRSLHICVRGRAKNHWWLLKYWRSEKSIDNWNYRKTNLRSPSVEFGVTLSWFEHVFGGKRVGPRLLNVTWRRVIRISSLSLIHFRDCGRCRARKYPIYEMMVKMEEGE